MDKIKIGILTISDRASAGIYEDKGGPAIIKLLSTYIKTPWKPVYEVVPDDVNIIKVNLFDMIEEENCNLVITTGGTGPSLRDVTPIVMEEICEKMLPGFGEVMRMNSLKYTPNAILSRQSAGIRGKSLIINLPGSPNAIKECLEVVFPAVPYCIDLIGGYYIETNDEVIKAHRPKQNS